MVVRSVSSIKVPHQASFPGLTTSFVLAAGLICRGLDYTHFRPPFRTKIYNIFHPFDPLGYRLESMVNSDYATIEPVHIHRMRRSSLPRIPNLGIRSSIAKSKPLLQSFWQYVSSTVIQNNSEPSSSSDPQTTIKLCNTSISNSTNHFTDEVGDRILSLKRKKNDDDDAVSYKHHHNKKLKPNEQREIEVTTTTSSSSSGTHQDDIVISTQSELLVSPNDDDNHLSCIQGKDGQMYPRTDYVLSENMIDAYASEWIVALKSHFRYWANR